MEKIYYSVGSANEAEGLTLHVAQADDNGYFLAGPESFMSIKARTDGRQLTIEEYVKSFYKGKLLTKEKYDQLSLDIQQNQYQLGHAGLVNEKGKQKAIEEIALSREFSTINTLLDEQFLINEVLRVAKLLDYTDEEIKQSLLSRKLDSQIVDYVMNHLDEENLFEKANDRLVEINSIKQFNSSL